MPGRITEMAAQTGAAADPADLIETVDVDDLSMAPTGTNKKLALNELAVYLETQGISGPPGPPGPQGPPGDGAASSYTHVQSTPDDIWVIDHGLGFNPSVTVVDSGGAQVEGDVRYVSVVQVTITFSAGFSGKAYLS